ncbi:MAG TPA: hypothetical protein VGD36_04240 [Xanthobacteraceae bacterium]
MPTILSGTANGAVGTREAAPLPTLSLRRSAARSDMLHHIDMAERFVQGQSFEKLRDG